MAYKISPFKSGNSLVITIPKSIAIYLDIKPGTDLWIAAGRNGTFVGSVSLTAVQRTIRHTK